MFCVLNRSGTCRPVKCKILLLNMNLKNVIHQTHCRKSHYTSLGLDPSASSKDIKAAYYNLSLKYHPDKNQGSAESTAKFREITAAYEVLCNPDKKRQYDRDLNLYTAPMRNEYYTTRSSNYYRNPARSGRTQHYNYDEHYKQHYEEYYRQRKMEQEHFRRRWEADRRYRYGDEYTGSSGYYSEGTPKFRMRELMTNKSFISLLSFWAFIILFAEMADHFNPDNTKRSKQGPVYYKTKERDLKSD